MTPSITSNTQAALLLTAPLMVGRRQDTAELLTPREYRSLARKLRENRLQPGALLSPAAEEVFQRCRLVVEEGRLRTLLGRGFQLSQALDHWRTRALWVVSLSDPEYPRRIKERLKEDAPPILYGCGDASILDRGGLAVVGSRHVDETLLTYASEVGSLAAAARRTLVSGGARGIDQASMRGALNGGGVAVGVLADSLERLAMTREHRNLIGEGQLVLVSPYDPGAGFNVGNAMGRNKLIYALADAALVVNADLEKGGTWSGAVEQLDKMRLVPIYVRSGGAEEAALAALERRGALPWPNPATPEALQALLETSSSIPDAQAVLPSFDEGASQTEAAAEPLPTSSSIGAGDEAPTSPADRLFGAVREILPDLKFPCTEDEAAAALGVNKAQARAWLARLVAEGMLTKQGKPARFSVPKQVLLPEICTPDRAA